MTGHGRSGSPSGAHRPDGAPEYRAAAAEYVATCLCGREFAAPDHDCAEESLRLHVASEAIAEIFTGEPAVTLAPAAFARIIRSLDHADDPHLRRLTAEVRLLRNLRKRVETLDGLIVHRHHGGQSTPVRVEVGVREWDDMQGVLGDLLAFDSDPEMYLRGGATA